MSFYFRKSPLCGRGFSLGYTKSFNNDINDPYSAYFCISDSSSFCVNKTN